MPSGEKYMALKETAFATILHNFYDFTLFPYSFLLITSSLLSFATYYISKEEQNDGEERIMKALLFIFINMGCFRQTLFIYASGKKGTRNKVFTLAAITHVIKIRKAIFYF